ncbi:MAG: hypothetical protein HOY69_03445 [Streptomyces sp.]|nr:hypothetical protein [Streptomyces sp.]
MTGQEMAELQPLTTFVVDVRPQVRRTTFDVRPAPAAPPVAQLVKHRPLNRPASYELFTGPGLAVPAGRLSESGALDADGRPVGVVNLTGGKYEDARVNPLNGAFHTYTESNPTRWHVVQPGLPRLAGRPASRASRMAYNKVTDVLGKVGYDIKGTWLGAMAFTYGAPGCDGFTVSLGRRGRFDVTVHDSRVDRRLVLACVTAVAHTELDSIRAEGVSMLTFGGGRR